MPQRHTALPASPPLCLDNALTRLPRLLPLLPLLRLLPQAMSASFPCVALRRYAMALAEVSAPFSTLPTLIMYSAMLVNVMGSISTNLKVLKAQLLALRRCDASRHPIGKQHPLV